MYSAGNKTLKLHFTNMKQGSTTHTYNALLRQVYSKRAYDSDTIQIPCHESFFEHTLVPLFETMIGIQKNIASEYDDMNKSTIVHTYCLLLKQKFNPEDKQSIHILSKIFHLSDTLNIPLLKRALVDILISALSFEEIEINGYYRLPEKLVTLLLNQKQKEKKEVSTLDSLANIAKQSCLANNQNAIRCLARAAHGKQVISGSNQGTISCSNSIINTNQILTIWPGSVTSLDATQKKPLLAIGGLTGEIGIANIQEQLTVKTVLIGHDDNITDLVFSPNEASLASASTDGTTCIWDIPSGIPMQKYSCNKDYFSCVTFIDENCIATGSSNGIVALWDTRQKQTGKALFHHKDLVATLKAIPGKTSIASGSDDHTIRIFDLRKNKKRTLKTFTRTKKVYGDNFKVKYQEAPLCLACSANGTIFCGTDFSRIIALDSSSGKKIESYECSEKVNDLCLLSNNEYAAGLESGEVLFIESPILD